MCVHRSPKVIIIRMGPDFGFPSSLMPLICKFVETRHDILFGFLVTIHVFLW